MTSRIPCFVRRGSTVIVGVLTLASALLMLSANDAQGRETVAGPPRTRALVAVPTPSADDVEPSLQGRWYRADSFWNTPIPADAPIRPESDQLVAALNDRQTGCVPYADANSCFGPGVHGTALYTSSPDDPLVTVRINDGECDARRVQVRIPPGAGADDDFPGTESHFALMDPDGTEWDFYKMTAPDVTPLPSNAGACPPSSDWAAALEAHSNPGWNGSGWLQETAPASGAMEGAGRIRPRDAETPAGGTYDHALAMTYPRILEGPVVATPVPKTGDGDCTDSQTCIPEGARLQLDPAIDCSAWPSLTAEYMRQWCRTLQKYGVIIVDRGGGGGLWSQAAVSLPAGFSWPCAPDYAPLPYDLTAHLRVIDWTRWTGG